LPLFARQCQQKPDYFRIGSRATQNLTDGDMTLWDFEKVMRHSLAHAPAVTKAGTR